MFKIKCLIISKRYKKKTVIKSVTFVTFVTFYSVDITK